MSDLPSMNDSGVTSTKMDGRKGKQPFVVIVGAGIAGITAADTFIKHNFTNFKILEASDRTGGRINSVEMGEGVVELGAHWIHGIEKNPIYQIAEQNDLLKLRNEDRTLRCRDLYLTEDGEEVGERMVKEVDMTYGRLLVNAEDYFRNHMMTPVENDTVGSHLDREFAAKYNDIISPPTCDKISQTRRLIFDHRKTLECCITGCDDMHDVSLSEFGCYEELPGVHYTIPPGFGTVLDILKARIPEENILLNTPVRCINWATVNADGQITVECENGNIFYADHVIVTVSLGVLKAACDRMFNPPLPESRRLAIQNTGFGIVDKVILEFEEPIVAEDIHRIELLWDNKRVSDRCLRETWTRKMYSFEAIQSNIYIGWLTGKEALYMESLTEDEIADACVQTLKHFLKKDIPKPRRVLRTRWGANPFTRGSYSYMHLGSCQQDIYELATPLFADNNKQKPVLLFAGEATHPTMYSTTHGALSSGQREARRVLSTMMDEADLADLPEPINGMPQMEPNGQPMFNIADSESDTNSDDEGPVF